MQDCLLQEDLALCPTGISSEPVEAELGAGSGGQVVLPPPGGNGNGNGGSSGQLNEDINALIIGPIFIGDVVSGVLDPEVGHGYTFSGGPTALDITLISSEELDGVIQVFDANNELNCLDG